MIRRLAPPTDLCVSLDDVKTHLRVDNDLEDLEIELILEAAIDLVERYTTRVLSEAEYEETFNAWPTAGFVDLGVAPIREVTAVAYTDSAGDEQTVGASSWYWRATQDGARVFFATGFSGPTLFGTGGDIVVRFLAGYNRPGQAADPPALRCPGAARLLVLKLVANAYAYRESVVVGSSANALPFGSQLELDSLRIYR